MFMQQDCRRKFLGMHKPAEWVFKDFALKNILYASLLAKHIVYIAKLHALFVAIFLPSRTKKSVFLYFSIFLQFVVVNRGCLYKLLILGINHDKFSIHNVHVCLYKLLILEINYNKISSQCTYIHLIALKAFLSPIFFLHMKESFTCIRDVRFKGGDKPVQASFNQT